MIKTVTVKGSKLGKTNRIQRNQAIKDNLENRYLSNIDFKMARRLERKANR